MKIRLSVLMKNGHNLINNLTWCSAPRWYDRRCVSLKKGSLYSTSSLITTGSIDGVFSLLIIQLCSDYLIWRTWKVEAVNFPFNLASENTFGEIILCRCSHCLIVKISMKNSRSGLRIISNLSVFDIYHWDQKIILLNNEKETNYFPDVPVVMKIKLIILTCSQYWLFD